LGVQEQITEEALPSSRMGQTLRLELALPPHSARLLSLTAQ
jgi:hypothetical protein